MGENFKQSNNQETKQSGKTLNLQKVIDVYYMVQYF